MLPYSIMSDWLKERVPLGKTDLRVGRVGIGASYGAPADALESAFDCGCNYFYWGALRRPQMAAAIRNIVARGVRDQLVVVLQVFRRGPGGLEKSLTNGLKRLGLDYADVLLLGWHNKPPAPRTLEGAEKLQEAGGFRYLGLSGHNRSVFPIVAKDGRFDLFHVRYNAANRGAEEDVFPQLLNKRPGVVAFNATKRMSLTRSNRIPADERRPTAGDCYRYVLTNASVDVVITGPSTAEQLKENLAEAAKGPMTVDEIEWMRRIGDYVYGR
jgi:aryl-alcohol dehydrogenase-like predicted oxidoreductase